MAGKSEASAAAIGPAEARIVVTDLTRRFGGVVALNEVNLRVGRGSVHALVGENGAGKSTLIKCLVGAIRPDSGSIRIDGHAVTFAGPAEAEAIGIRAIHQELNLVPSFSVVENVFLGRRYPRRFGMIDRRAMRETVAHHAHRLAPGLPLDSAVGSLSPGQQQMAEIVRALSADARVVIMDEPTAALGSGDTERLFDAVRTMRSDGVSVIYVSHRLEEVLSLADAITVMRDGAVAASQPNRDLNKDRLVALMSPAARTRSSATRLTVASERDSGDISPAVPSLMTIRMPGTETSGRPASTGSIDLGPGRIIGLYGLLGSGRSHLLAALFGAAPMPDGVSVEYRGAPFAPRSTSEAIGAGLAFVPEDRRSQGLVMHHPVRVNLTLPLLDRFRRWRAIPCPDRRRENAFARKTIADLSIKTTGPEQPIDALSGGNQQKALLGRWFAAETSVFLLDEPTRGIDVGAKAELHGQIQRLAADGAGIIFASSDLEEIMELADRVYVLDRGRIAADLSGDAATPDAILTACYARNVPDSGPDSDSDPTADTGFPTR